MISRRQFCKAVGAGAVVSGVTSPTVAKSTTGISEIASGSTTELTNRFLNPSSVDTQYGELAQLRWNTEEIGGVNGFRRMKAKLAALALDPWEREYMGRLYEDEGVPCCVDALVEVHRRKDRLEFGTLLEFQEYWCNSPDDYPPPRADDLTFGEWVRNFQPKGRDDFMMAMTLYRRYRNTGEVIPRINATLDPWLDAFLASTRGILLWTHQWTELLRISGHRAKEAMTLLYDYINGREDAIAKFNDLTYPITGQTVMQIVKERSLDGNCFGNPDYLVGDWLYKYYRAKRLS